MLSLVPTPIESSPDDAEELLASRAQAGDARAASLLFERHASAISRFLRDLLRDADRAQDAAQEVFARAHALLPKVASPLRFRPWLVGIARNVAFESRRIRSHEAYDEDGSGPDAFIASPDPERAVLNRELEGQFNGALASLSPHRRAAFLMRADLEMSYEDIASEFGWTLAMVKNEIHRARLNLRSVLLPYIGSER